MEGSENGRMIRVRLRVEDMKENLLLPFQLSYFITV
jgi:hypothetical protein